MRLVFLGEKPVMKAGEYELASGASMEAIVKELSTGSPLQYAVIVPEGLTSAMILSLLYKHTPDECRFIMIDPKVVDPEDAEDAWKSAAAVVVCVPFDRVMADRRFSAS